MANPNEKKRSYSRCYRGPKYNPVRTGLLNARDRHIWENERPEREETYIREEQFAAPRYARDFVPAGRTSNYNPEQHLLAQLNHMCGIPARPDVLKVLQEWVSSQRIDPHKLSVYDVIHMIGDLGMPSTYYSSAPALLMQLRGEPVPSVSAADIAKLRFAFAEQRAAYFTVAKRMDWEVGNGFPLQFLLFKLSQLFGWTRIERMCRLYTTVDHAVQAEDRWRLICEYLGWQYIPTPQSI